MFHVLTRCTSKKPNVELTKTIRTGNQSIQNSGVRVDLDMVTMVTHHCFTRNLKQKQYLSSGIFMWSGVSKNNTVEGNRSIPAC